MQNQNEVYDIPKLNGSMMLATVGGACVTLAILLVLPLTQLLSQSLRQDTLQRKVEIVREPPQPPPPEPEAKQQQKQTEQPKLESPAEQLNLEQLQIALSPTMGDADAGTFSAGSFSLGSDAIGDMQIFDVADLDRIPQAISFPKFIKPKEFEERGLTGAVRLKVLITPDGRVRFAGVHSSDHPEFVEHARKFAEKIRYESPMRNGQKVTTKFILPLNY